MANKRRSPSSRVAKPTLRPRPIIRKARPRARTSSSMRSLDAVASAYARLLTDPCNGPLVHPIYAGGEGGYLARYEKDFISLPNAIATSTAGAICWTPALLCSPTVDSTDFQNGVSHSSVYLAADASNPTTGALTDTTACNWINYKDGQPGFDQLSTMAGGVRCVAACMQITFPGTELQRSGVVSLAQLPDANAVLRTGSHVNPAVSFTVGGMRAVSPVVSRTPETTMEVKWKPSIGDQAYKTPDAVSHSDTSRHSCLTATWSGIPAGVGMRIRMVAVYEWVPRAANGLMNSNESRARTPYTLDQVLNYLDMSGNWVYGSMRYASMAYKAYQTLLGSQSSRGMGGGRIAYGEL